MKFVKEIYPYVLIIIGVLFIKAFVVTPIRVNGSSMYPTLHEKDIMLLDKMSYRFSSIKRYDIVVVETEENYLIKRVIGLPGEHIEYIDNQLYIDGKRTKEKISNLKTTDFDSDTFGKGPIPDDYYLVLGDNRENSTDSRVIGFVSKKQILGKTSFTIFPFDRFGKRE